MILWGPPGVGKTTLARLLADAFCLEFITISAVLGGVKDIRDAVAFAHQHQPRGTLVFVDEVHRFNKAQQDAFLPHMESGLFTLVGATTENPSFEVNSALLSRAAVHVLRRLDPSALRTLAERAFQVAWPGVSVTEEGFRLLVDTADGDGRRLLNLIDTLAPTETTLDRNVIAGRLGERVRQAWKPERETRSASHSHAGGHMPRCFAMKTNLISTHSRRRMRPFFGCRAPS
jgi:putative ATPase